MRILNIAAFAVSGYASTEGRHCKPFNPLLGETYEADYPDKGIRFFSEKVLILGGVCASYFLDYLFCLATLSVSVFPLLRLCLSSSLSAFTEDLEFSPLSHLN